MPDNSVKPETNVISLFGPGQAQPIRNRHKQRMCAPAPDAADDPIVAEGMRLIRSFLLIEDCNTRASIIQVAEKAAEKNPIFKTK